MSFHESETGKAEINSKSLALEEFCSSFPDGCVATAKVYEYVNCVDTFGARERHAWELLAFTHILLKNEAPHETAIDTRNEITPA